MSEQKNTFLSVYNRNGCVSVRFDFEHTSKSRRIPNNIGIL